MKRGRFEYLSDVDEDGDDDDEPEEREIYNYLLNDREAEILNIQRPQRWYLNNIDANTWRAYVRDKIINAPIFPDENEIGSRDLRTILAAELHAKHPYFGTFALNPEDPKYQRFIEQNKEQSFRLVAADGATSKVISRWSALLNAYRTNNDIYFASLSKDVLTPDLFDTYDRIALSVEITAGDGVDDGHAILWLIDNGRQISYILDSSGIVTNITLLAEGLQKRLEKLKAKNRDDYVRIMHNLIAMKTHPYINLLGGEASRSLPIEYLNVSYQQAPLYRGDCAIYVMWFMLWLFFHPSACPPHPPPMPLHEPMAMRHFIVETLESGELKIPKKMLSSLYYAGTEHDPTEQIIERVNAYYDPKIGSGWLKKRVRRKRVCRKKKT